MMAAETYFDATFDPMPERTELLASPNSNASSTMLAYGSAMTEHPHRLLSPFRPASEIDVDEPLDKSNFAIYEQYAPEWSLISTTFQSEREAVTKEFIKKLRDLKLTEERLENTNQNFYHRAEQDFINLSDKLTDYQDRLDKREEKYGLEEEFMNEIKEIQSNRVRLNVGGKTFYTSTITLSKIPDSLLAKITTEQEPEVDGSWFIDRDNTHFNLILNFLRDNELPQYVREDAEIMDELLQEAEYYGITELTDLRWNELPRVTQEELKSLYPHPTSRKRDTVFILERKDLSGLDFSDYNINPRSSFHGSNLERADFSKAHFVFEFESQVNFSYCYLKGTLLPEEATTYRSPGVYFNLADADKEGIIYTSH